MVDVTAFRLRLKVSFVDATVADVTMLARVTTVPDPQPLTVQSFALKVRAGVWAVPMV